MTLNEAGLRTFAAELTAELGGVGAQVAVYDGHRVVEAAIGTANAETGVPVTPDTLFTVGSTTKVHTAALLMTLVDEGLVDLDEPVVSYLPSLKLADPAWLRALTPRHLLAMSSGIDNGPYVDCGRGDDALRRYVEGLAELPMLFRPGTGFGYSNASTNISGLIVESITGQDWDSALRDRILEPAGLMNSFTLPEHYVHRRLAIGHAADPDGEPVVLPHWWMPRALGPAGASLCAPARDLLRFGRVFLDSGVSEAGIRVLSEDAVKHMQQPQTDVPATLLADFWGLGPYGKTWGGRRFLGHSGTTSYGSSYLLWAPDDGVAVATMVNTAPTGYPFAHRVFTHVFGELLGVEVPTKPVPDDALRVDTERFVGTYEMSGMQLIVGSDADGLTSQVRGGLGAGTYELRAPGRLRPLTDTTFLPTDPSVDGGRGWAVAFVGPEQQPATHLVNGFLTLRRVHD